MNDTKKKIVIVEDEQDLGFLTQEILSKEKMYEVFWEADPEQGKALCLKIQPDLVLLDYVMPKCYGTEVVSFLRAQPQTKHAVIIMMSGLVLLKNGSAGLQAGEAEKNFSKIVLQNAASGAEWVSLLDHHVDQCGVDAFLAKPFSKKLLLEVVQRFLQGTPKT